jgi:hypothetical protein
MQQFISIEEQNMLVCGFFKYALEQMHTDNWELGRRELIKRFEIEQDIHVVVNDQAHPTFQELMERHHDDLDYVLLKFFCQEIIHLGWFEAYCIQLNPNWDKRIANVYCYWTFDGVLKKWFCRSSRDAREKRTNPLDELKEVLELNLSLK